jgi:hypothetical protein
MDADAAEEIEKRMAALEAALREAVKGGDRASAAALHGELGQAMRAWESVLGLEPLAAADAPQAGALLPLREQVHESLALLSVPSSPKRIAQVHQAFFATSFPSSQLTSIRRDEARSFETAPGRRPYYICGALGLDHLEPARGLLAISTWPLERRIVGPMSPSADNLVAAISIAEAVARLPSPPRPALELLARAAAGVPGVPRGSAGSSPDPGLVLRAARAQLDTFQADDERARAGAARQARARLSEAEQMFGPGTPGPPGPGRGIRPPAGAAPDARPVP